MLNSKSTKQILEISAIRQDEQIQPRQALNQEVVTEYSFAMKQGDEFPPIIVFYDGSNYWLADGYHRIAAVQANGDLEIIAERKCGSRRDAILYAAGANSTHGLRRNNADKRRVVERLLQDPEWCRMSDNAIAHQCGVSQPFVGKIRQQVLSTYNEFKSTSRKGADGRIINVSNIGQNNKEKTESSIESNPGMKNAVNLAQPILKADISHDRSVDNLIKYVQFPLDFNGERFKVKGTVTHLQIKWQYGDQTGSAQVPISQAILLDQKSVS